jgi:hypothetical protein
MSELLENEANRTFITGTVSGTPALELHAARFAFHSVVKARIAEKIALGMPENFGQAYYEKAMNNYDNLLSIAANEHSFEANDEDMKKGYNNGT